MFLHFFDHIICNIGDILFFHLSNRAMLRNKIIRWFLRMIMFPILVR